AGRVATVSTDEKGNFRVEHLPHQVLYVNLADRWQHGGVVRRTVFPIDGKATRLDFGGPNPVKGRLLQNGKPIATKKVELSTDSQYFGIVLMTSTTDADGRFTFFGPPVGHYVLFSEGDASRNDWVKVRDVDATGEPAELGDI